MQPTANPAKGAIKAPRQSTMTRKPMSYMVDPGLVAALRNFALENKMTVADVVESAFVEFLRAHR